jgi:hypothetical protein
MAWLGLISLGLVAEIAMIILLGRRVTDRYEAGQAELREIPTPRRTSAPVSAGTADATSTAEGGRREDPLVRLGTTPAPPPSPAAVAPRAPARDR